MAIEHSLSLEDVLLPRTTIDCAPDRKD